MRRCIVAALCALAVAAPVSARAFLTATVRTVAGAGYAVEVGVLRLQTATVDTQVRVAGGEAEFVSSPDGTVRAVAITLTCVTITDAELRASGAGSDGKTYYVAVAENGNEADLASVTTTQGTGACGTSTPRAGVAGNFEFLRRDV